MEGSVYWSLLLGWGNAQLCTATGLQGLLSGLGNHCLQLRRCTDVTHVILDALKGRWELLGTGSSSCGGLSSLVGVVWLSRPRLIWVSWQLQRSVFVSTGAAGLNVFVWVGSHQADSWSYAQSSLPWVCLAVETFALQMDCRDCSKVGQATCWC